MSEPSLPEAQTQAQQVQAQREQMRNWAVRNMSRIYSVGYQTALADGDPKEMRQWAELLSRLGGAFPEKQVDPQAGLSVFQFNFAGSGVRLQTIQTPETIEGAVREVLSPVDELQDLVESPSPRDVQDVLGHVQDIKPLQSFRVEFSDEVPEDLSAIEDLLGMRRD